MNPFGLDPTENRPRVHAGQHRRFVHGKHFNLIVASTTPGTHFSWTANRQDALSFDGYLGPFSFHRSVEHNSQDGKLLVHLPCETPISQPLIRAALTKKIAIVLVFI